jgi:hypothetical protein
MSALGHSRPGPAGRRSSHVRYAPKATVGHFGSEGITARARVSSCPSPGGSLRSRLPNPFAFLRLITKSYLAGACTGSSAGFVTLRMRSTFSAARRNWSTLFGP